MTSQSARPPPLVLVIYEVGGGGYEDYLVASGFRVAEAHTGAQGFDRAVTLRPDLIVLDFGLDGETVAPAGARHKWHSDYRACRAHEPSRPAPEYSPALAGTGELMLSQAN